METRPPGAVFQAACRDGGGLERTLGRLTEFLDTDTAGGILFSRIFDALAQFERSVIRERVQAGLQSAHKNGVQLGRPRVVSEEKLSAARALLKEGGLSKRAVALQFGISAPTLYRYLRA